MKINRLLCLLIFAGFLLGGCTSGSPTSPVNSAMEMTTLFKGCGDFVGGGGADSSVAHSQSALDALWGSLYSGPAPQVNFNASMVVAAYWLLCSGNCGCNSVEILSVEDSADCVNVSVEEKAYVDCQGPIMAVYSHFVAIPKSSKPICFQTSNTLLSSCP